jgi:geranylgeranyl pyrophosphate synthase
LLLLQHTNAENRPGVAELIFRGNAEDRARLLALVTGNGVLSESLAMVDKYIIRAEANLADLPANSHTATLSALLNFIATKTKHLLKKEEVAA